MFRHRPQSVTPHAILIAIGLLFTVEAVVAQELLRISEQSLRRQALKKVLPIYPKASVEAGKEGVAVALIEALPDGTVDSIQVLQAPDEHIAAAIRTALKQWRVEELRVVGSTKRYKSQGKITFYFRVSGGKGQVIEPDQMPGNEGIFAPPPTRGTAGAAQAGSAPRPRRAPIPEIGQTELIALKAKDRVLLLDLRDRNEFVRGHSGGSVNLPYDELFVRARAEIDRSVVIVLDATHGEPSMISTAGRILQGMGFDRVRVLIP